MGSARRIPTYLSLGAGVQSSTLALMAAKGELGPMPAGAIFADTRWEPKSVYRWLDWLEAQLPYPVHRVTAGDLGAEAMRRRVSKRTGREYVREIVPLFMAMPDGSRGMLWRRCSRDYKIRPIQRTLRELAKVPSRGRSGVYAISWIGISIDEASRMKPSRESWLRNEWPLIDAEISRDDCKAWMRRKGYPEPPRSACVFCPYHSDGEWMRLRDHAPEDFARAVAWERSVHAAAIVGERYIGTPYAWRGLKPLAEADFGRDPRQGTFDFDSECEGICGV